MSLLEEKNPSKRVLIKFNKSGAFAFPECGNDAADRENADDISLILMYIPSDRDDEATAPNCRKFLEAFSRSNFFQNNAGRIKSLSFYGFLLHDWKFFLETFARYQPKLTTISFNSCHFTWKGANALEWALDNEKNGIHMDCLHASTSTGSNAWISGLHKNTSLKYIKVDEHQCGIPFLNFMKQCNRSQYEHIYFHGWLMEDCDDDEDDDDNEEGQSDASGGDDVDEEEDFHDEEGFYDAEDFRGAVGGLLLDTTFHISQYSMRIQLCSPSTNPDDDVEPVRYPAQITKFYDWGKLFVVLHRRRIRGEFTLGRFDLLWERLQHLLSFSGENPTAVHIKLRSEGTDIVRQTSCFDKVPLTLGLEGSLSEIGARGLGWVLDSDTSGVNIEEFTMNDVSGSFAWVPGFHKNTTIKTLDMVGMNFLGGIARFLQNGKARKLETLGFYNMGNGNDRVGAPLTETSNDLSSLKNICFGYFDDQREDDGSYLVMLPTKICESIGNALRRSTKLTAILIRGIMKNPEYDFINDVVSCHHLHLHDTDLEQGSVVSLIDRCQAKELSLNWKLDSTGWDKGVEFLGRIDLSSLDHLAAGEYLTQKSLSALCQQFHRNRGPRMLSMCLVLFEAEYDGTRFITRSFNDEDIEQLGTSLAGNTKIEDIKLIVENNVHPSSMLKFLQCLSKMPSLKLVTISVWSIWRMGWWMRSLAREGDDRYENEQQRLRKIRDDFERCQQLIMGQLVERNVEINLFSWMGDNTFEAIFEALRKCKLLLGRNTNDTPDGLWAHVFAYTATTNKDVLFYLLRELPGLFQKAGNQTNNQGPRFVVPHHPDCPGCHKRQKAG